MAAKAKKSGKKVEKTDSGDLSIASAEESQSSIELSRDAKGVARWSIKVYCPNDMPALKKALNKVLSLDKALRNNTMA